LGFGFLRAQTQNSHEFLENLRQIQKQWLPNKASSSAIFEVKWSFLNKITEKCPVHKYIKKYGSLKM
jgi:hypothetical protein